MEDPNLVNKGGRPNKRDKFNEERHMILIKLNNILGITDHNKIFYLYDIDDNPDKQDQIWESMVRSISANRK